MKKFRLYYEEHNKGPLKLLWKHFAPQHFAFFGLVLLIILLAFVMLLNYELLIFFPFFQFLQGYIKNLIVLLEKFYH